MASKLSDFANNFASSLRKIIENIFPKLKKSDNGSATAVNNADAQPVTYQEFNAPKEPAQPLSQPTGTGEPQSATYSENVSGSSAPASGTEGVYSRYAAAPASEEKAADNVMSYEDYIAEMKKGYQEQLDAANKQAEQTKARAMADAETAYSQNKATYGSNGETMAQMGLSGGGYSDYLNAQAYAQKRADVQVAKAQEIVSKDNARATYQQYIQAANEKLAEKALYDERLADQRAYEKEQTADQRAYEQQLLAEQRAYSEQQAAETKKQNVFDSLWAGVQSTDTTYTDEAIDSIAKEYGLSDEQVTSLKNILRITKENQASGNNKVDTELSNQLLQQAIIDIKSGVADKDYLDTLKDLGMTDEDYGKAIDYLNTYNKNKANDEIQQSINSGDLENAENQIESGVKDGTVDEETKYKNYYDIAIKDASNCKTISDATACRKRMETSKNAGNLSADDYANALKYLYANVGKVLSSNKYSVAYDSNVFGTELPNASCLKVTLNGKTYKIETIQSVVDNDTATVLNGVCGNRVTSGTIAKIDDQIYIYRTYPKQTNQYKNGWIKVKIYNWWTSGIGTDNESFYSAFDKEFETVPAAKAADHTPVSAQTGTWKSYDDAAKAGYSNIRTKNEFARSNNDDKQKYGTYANYLDAMYRKYVLNENA